MDKIGVPAKAFTHIPSAFTLPEVFLRYGDAILRERPIHVDDLFSRRHPKMSRQNRAKIFAPFAALDGFSDRVRRKEIVYVSKHELDADETWELNEKLYQLHLLTANSRLARANSVRVSVEYFVICSDPENEAFGLKGEYRIISGIVQRADPITQALILLADGATVVLPFADIYRILVQDDTVYSE